MNFGPEENLDLELSGGDDHCLDMELTQDFSEYDLRQVECFRKLYEKRRQDEQ